MKLCAEICLKNKQTCDQRECRNWISYDEDLNCVEIAVEKNGSMILHEVAKRLDISYVRVSQIEKVAISKLQKKAFTKEDTNYYTILKIAQLGQDNKEKPDEQKDLVE